MIDMCDHPSEGGLGPWFSMPDHAEISDWSERMRHRGLRVKIATGYDGIDEVMQVVPRWDEQPRWLVWRTDGGKVAVTITPGLPKLVETLVEALAIIEAEVDADDT